MYNMSRQVVLFPCNANEERVFVTIINCSSQVKFIVVISSCGSTFGKVKEIWEREMISSKNYLVTLNQR